MDPPPDLFGLKYTLPKVSLLRSIFLSALTNVVFEPFVIMKTYLLSLKLYWIKRAMEWLY